MAIIHRGPLLLIAGTLLFAGAWLVRDDVSLADYGEMLIGNNKSGVVDNRRRSSIQRFRGAILCFWYQVLQRSQWYNNRNHQVFADEGPDLLETLSGTVRTALPNLEREIEIAAL